MASRGRILVAYIATGGGIDAVRLAVALATERELGIDIVMARAADEVTPGLYPKIRGYDSIIDEQLAGWLADARAEVPEGIEVTTRVAVGESVPDTLIATAQELGSRMIVVGSHGGGIFRRLSLGSAVNTLLQSSPVPVAVAPRGYNYAGPIQRVTVLFGDRPGAADIVGIGLDYTQRWKTQLRFISLNIDGDRPTDTDPLRALEHTATAQLAEQARARVAAGTATAAVVDAPSIEAAVGSLDWHAGDISFLGAARVAPSGRIFPGSTASQILHHAPVPAVIIPQGAWQHDD